MKLIVGLGNPDKKYHNTRHNLGQMVISRLTEIPNTKIITLQTYMNLSGPPVQKEAHFYKIPPSNILIIHDDLDLEVGEYRLQFDRGPAGHNGIKSIIESLGTKQFWRLRIGIGRPLDQTPVEDFVLRPFSVEEKNQIDQTIDKIVADRIIDNWARS